MSEEFDLTVFGAGQSIGKSCFLLSVHGIYILLDCGCYVGRDNKKALPDLSKLPHDITVNDISAVLISHFHMDHVGGLVYLTEELGYKGDIYVSGPTRAILPIVFKNTRTLISTQMQLQTPAPVELFADLVKRLKDVSVNEAIHINDRLCITPHIAGHVIGAVMWEVRIDDRSILYTGDYSEDGTTFIPSYQLPQHLLNSNSVDMLIMECTYGTVDFKPLKDRQTELVRVVLDTVRNNGKVLIPCYAIGFTQEVIALIQEALSREELSIPIYCSSSDSRSILPFYKLFSTWVTGTISNISSSVQQFRASYLNSPKPFILFASSASMCTGVSKMAFDRLASNPNNTVIFLGQNSPDSFIGQMLQEGATLENGTPVQCKRIVIPFSAHPDRKAGVHLIERTQPQCVVLIHGERSSCAGFIKHYLNSHEDSPLLLMPETGRTIEFDPEGQHIRMSLKHVAKIQGDGIKRLCTESIIDCNDGKGIMDNEVVLNMVCTMDIPCPADKWEEIMKQNEIEDDVMDIRYEDGVVKMKWLEGFEEEALSIIEMIFCVCNKPIVNEQSYTLVVTDASLVDSG